MMLSRKNTDTELNLAEMFAQAGLISPEQLKDILESQQKEKRDINQILVERGFITAEELATLSGLRQNIPFVDLKQQKISPEVLHLIPGEMAKKYNVIPLAVVDGSLMIAMEQPWNIQVISDLTAQVKMMLKPVLATISDIKESININYKISGELQNQIDHIDVPAIEQTPESTISVNDISEAPLVRAVNMIVGQAIKDRASDIHIEAQNDRLRIRYRIDGILHDAMSLPLGVHLQLVSRLKVIAGMNIAEKRRPQDGQFTMKLEGKEIDVRVATTDTVNGELMVLRILDRSFAVLGLSQLGFLPESLEKYLRMINTPFGMILLSGPTGSGKTTTLYASLNKLNFDERNVMTIEDPVEYRFNNINQIQVNSRAGLTFASGLKALMRLDPDVILVGEIRDSETAHIAIQAALTGHLVLSSIHANDSVGALFRLLDLGVEPFLISSALIGVVAQRMVRRICPYCHKPVSIDNAEQLMYERELKEQRTEFFQGEGCNLCADTGYLGRSGVYEVMVMTEKIRQMFLNNASIDDMRNQAISDGMSTMWHDGMQKVKLNTTTIHELLQNVYSINT